MYYVLDFARFQFVVRCYWSGREHGKWVSRWLKRKVRHIRNDVCQRPMNASIVDKSVQLYHKNGRANIVAPFANLLRGPEPGVAHPLQKCRNLFDTHGTCVSAREGTFVVPSLAWYASEGDSVGCTEIGKKAWLFDKLQPGRARKKINAT